MVTSKSRVQEYGQQIKTGNRPNEVRYFHELLGRIALQEKQFDVAIKELQMADRRHTR